MPRSVRSLFPLFCLLISACAPRQPRVYDDVPQPSTAPAPARTEADELSAAIDAEENAIEEAYKRADPNTGPFCERLKLDRILQEARAENEAFRRQLSFSRPDAQAETIWRGLLTMSKEHLRNCASKKRDASRLRNKAPATEERTRSPSRVRFFITKDFGQAVPRALTDTLFFV